MITILTFKSNDLFGLQKDLIKFGYTVRRGNKLRGVCTFEVTLGE